VIRIAAVLEISSRRRARAAHILRPRWQSAPYRSASSDPDVAGRELVPVSFGSRQVSRASDISVGRGV